MLNEGIVLFCCAAGEWLEPVCVVCNPILAGPLLHPCCHSISDAAIQGGTVINDICELLVYIDRKVFEHLLSIEYILTEEF